MSPVLQNVRADDFVEYFIYPSAENTNTGDNLSELHSKVLSFASAWVKTYFWHQDKFNLSRVTSPESENDSPHLHGVVRYGENIDDEWFVVYLMQNISKNFDVMIRIIDSDGEFLLIEAANYLCKWMKPECCDRRVYLHRGVIRVIPIDALLKIDKLDSVVTYLSSSREITETERNITNCIDAKLQKFSGDLEQLLHRSRVYLPAKVAALLDAKPLLISAAITAFFNRDTIDAKICRKMEHFPPEELVLRSITFTKFSYAMLSQERSNPERNLWTLPPSSDEHYKEHLLGYKITGGFEILASKCTKKSKSDLSLSKKWNQYLQVLKKKGYFKDLLEHSKEYVKLEKKARMYFLDNVGVEETSCDDILSILQMIKYSVEEMKQEEASVPVSDDEKWMDVTENQFNQLLEERFGLKGVDATNSPNVLSSAINKFLHQISDVEGIELEDDDIASQKNETDVEIESNRRISFSSTNFMASVQQMLKELNEANVENKNSTNDSDDEDDDADDSSTDDENAPEDPDMKTYMDLMAKEVANTTLSKSFVNESDETLDMDAMSNIRKSVEEQFGGSGPAGNILHSLGLKLDVKRK